MTKYLIYALSLLLLMGCKGKSITGNNDTNIDSLRVVSINGTVSEILADLGLEKQIVGTDVASTYPELLKAKPKVGHNRNIAVEGILTLNPNLVVGTKKEIKPETVEQLEQAGLRVLLFDQEYTTAGSKALIKSLADSLGLSSKGDALVEQLDKDLKTVEPYAALTAKPKVLFIYARGAGTMMVGGKGTQVDQMIAYAGGVNVAQDIQDYKPLTAEALVKYNPEVILLFDTGLTSLGNVDGVLTMQGVSQTIAGKQKKIIQMDGQLLSGFGPRLGKAIAELHQKIN